MPDEHWSFDRRIMRAFPCRPGDRRAGLPMTSANATVTSSDATRIVKCR